MKYPTITAEVIADSISLSGVRIVTLEIVVPRIIWSEFMTHRVFSRNAASSRAVPVKSMLAMIRENPARPAHWGLNQPGMQAFETNSNLIAAGYTADEWWDLAAASAVSFAEQMDAAGYHKQVVNRLTEPFSYMKAVVTATSYDNFFHLRVHEMADPTIHALANTMLQAVTESKPRSLIPGEWHVPYYKDGYWSETESNIDSYGYTLHEALMISSSCCAQVSYRKLNDTLEKAEDVFAKLNIEQDNDDPCHASPCEHQASPMTTPVWHQDLFEVEEWQEGVTHMDRQFNLYSGNFKHWIQYRQLIAGHDCKVYTR
jgi:hypothetical protein